jgi:spore protease
MPYRTDLAAETVGEPHCKNLLGLEQQDESFGGLKIHTVRILTPQTAEIVGKPVGEYITITAPTFAGEKEITEEEHCRIASIIKGLLPEQGLILVVGLGNNDITPDAIGPRTVHQVLATRHISSEIKRQAGLESLRAVAVLSPGVLGQTGIETSEIISALVADISPAAVIVIDALAARSADRLCNTVQISNSGISPGSGVMNSRKELSRRTLGVPVVSIGVPTVVDASTLAGDLLPGEEDIDQLRSLFEPEGRQMMITPREIDTIISHACLTLSMSINKALHPDMSLEEINYLVS